MINIDMEVSEASDDISAIVLDKNMVYYIDFMFSQWEKTVKSNSNIEFGGRLFKNFLINNILVTHEEGNDDSDR